MGVEEHYRPPIAEPPSERPLVRPRAVKLAMVMMLVGVGLGQYIILTQFSLERIVERPLNLGVLLLFIGLIALLWAMIWRRRSWARSVFALLLIPGFLQGIALAVFLLSKGEMVGVLVALHQVFMVVANVLLYSKKSNAWFSSKEKGT